MRCLNFFECSVSFTWKLAWDFLLSDGVIMQLKPVLTKRFYVYDRHKHTCLFIQQKRWIVQSGCNKPIIFVTQIRKNTRSKLTLASFRISNSACFFLLSIFNENRIFNRFYLLNNLFANRWNQERLFKAFTWRWQFLRRRSIAMKAFCFHKKMAAMMTFTVRKEALPSSQMISFVDWKQILKKRLSYNLIE